MAIDLATLQAELNSDPLRRGYGARIDVGDMSGVVRMLNSREFSNIDKLEVASVDVISRLDWDEVVLMQPGKLAILTLLLATEGVKVNDRTKRAITLALELAPSSRSAVTTFLQRPSSRAEVLFGAGETVSEKDVRSALAR